MSKIILLGICLVLATATAEAKHKYKYKDRCWPGYDSRLSYYSYSDLPPGLAKRHGYLPPGLQKQMWRRGYLPPGLERRGGARIVVVIR